MALLKNTVLPENFPFYCEILDSGRPHILKEDVLSLMVMPKGRIHCHGETPLSLSKPAVIFLPAGTRISVNPGGRIFRFLFLETFLLAGESPLYQNVSDSLFSSRDICTADLKEDGFKEVLYTAENILGEFSRRHPGYQSIIRLKFQELLVYMHRLGITRPDLRKQTAAWSLDEILGYLAKSYSENHSLTALAGKCGLSAPYFSRMFHEQTGMPLFEYINRLRIEKPCRRSII